MGEESECQIIRIDSGDFKQFKTLILGLKKDGYNFGEGSLFVTSLMSHLVRLGAAGYINELTDFTSWIKDTLGGVVIPAVLPFSAELPVEKNF